MDGTLARPIAGNISTCGKPELIIFNLMICHEIALELHSNLDVSGGPAGYHGRLTFLLVVNQLASLNQSSLANSSIPGT